MTKEKEIMQFLHENVFDEILDSSRASSSLKRGVRLTIVRMDKLDAKGMRQYFWSAVIGTDKSIDFARKMKVEGFNRFEEVIEPFKNRFTDTWLMK